MIKLQNQVAVIVPKKTNDGRSTKQTINKINKLFCLNFGGYFYFRSFRVLVRWWKGLP